jgi:membrane fusion protein (multidrug efflux system)
MDGTVYEHEGLFDLLEPGLRTETGSRQTRVTFPNPDRKLLPGQFLKLRFKGDTKTNAVLVPQRAVLQGPKGPFVYVVGAEDKVEMRDVTATDWQGGQWLIEAGLKAGDRVVVNGLLRIAPGMPVKPVEGSSATPPADASLPTVPPQDKQ